MSVPKWWSRFPSPMPQDQNGSGGSGLGQESERYICAVAGCVFKGGYIEALEHHVNTSHGIKLRKMPHWPDVKFPEFMQRRSE